MKLELRHVDCGYPGLPPVLRDVSLAVESGEICCLLGPNGSGKTTLFKSIMRFIKLQGGEIRINGEDIAAWPVRRLARTVAYVAQVHVPPFPYLVRDVVMLGRIPSTGYFGQPTPRDYDAAQTAMEEMDVVHLQDRPYTDISGGERRLVMLARALAQEPQILVLDEPTANLDYGHMLRVIGKIRRLKTSGYAVIMTTHLPEQAFLCDANVALLHRDGPLLFGPASGVVTERNLTQVYGVRIKIVEYLDARNRPVRLCSPVLEP